MGVFKQGVQCKDCRYNAHKKCSERVPKDCTGGIGNMLLICQHLKSFVSPMYIIQIFTDPSYSPTEMDNAETAFEIHLANNILNFVHEDK